MIPETEELYDPADLGQKLKLSAEKVVRLTREKGWPHVRLTGKTIRYTHEDYLAIVASSRKSSEAAAVGLPGQTKASRRRA